MTGSSRSDLVRDMLASSQGALHGRVDALDAAAVHLLTRGALDDEARTEARRAAHQLVSLGVFGVPQGAQLATSAEALLAAPDGVPAEQGAALAELSAGIRDALDNALADPHPQSRQPVPRPQTAPATTRTADVLVVDDDPVLVSLLRRALEGSGWTVRDVQDGPSALAAVDVSAAQRPRLVLLDVDLPALDGFGVLRAMEARGLLPEVKVLCLTARASQADVLSLLSLGAVDHVAKPFSLPVLMARISNALGSR